VSPKQHFAVSIGSGVILAALLRSWTAGLACFTAGVFIDLDHFIDFWLNRGFSLDPAKLLDFCYYGTSKKFFDVLHGWEYVPLLLWVSTGSRASHIGWGVTVGYTLHLIGDQFFNTHLHPCTYFISYRAFHRFESSRIVLKNPFLPEGPPSARPGCKRD
jgi:hypothetical protein